MCRPCWATYMREWRKRNPEAARAIDKRKYANDPRKSERRREYHQAHPEVNRHAARRYYERESELVKSRVRDWRRDNPEALKRYRRRTEIARRAEDREAAAAYIDMLARDPCAYCGAEMEHVDHIDPLALGGSPEWDNLTAACESCNTSKSARPLLYHLLAA